MKNFKRNSIIIFIITIVLMYIVLKDNFSESISIILNTNLLWILVAIVIYFIYLLIESVVMQKLINQFNPNYSLKKSISLLLMSRFFNGITPFATGGQPLQIYELKKEKIKIADGTLITFEHFFVFQISITILALISIIVNAIFNLLKSDPFLNILSIYGFVFSFVILIVVYIFSINQNLNRKIIKFIAKILSKVKIIKNKNKALETIDNACNDYYYGFKELSKNRKLVVELILLETLSLIVWFIMPLYIFYSMGYFDINIFICLLVSIYIYFVGSYIPIPGGSGGMEYAYLGYFSTFIPSNFLAPSLIVWRFLNYYLPMIIGGIIFNFRKK